MFQLQSLQEVDLVIPEDNKIFRSLWLGLPILTQNEVKYFTSLNHHFRPLDERDTAYDYRDYWIAVKGCPT